MNKKILRGICLCCAASILITTISVALIFYNLPGFDRRNLPEALFSVFFVIILIYIGALIAAYVISDKITRPIKDLDLSAETHENVYEELSPLVRRIERQNREISRQIDRVKRQKNRLQVVGESMSDGLIVFDGDGNIISLNSSAEKIFKTDSSVVGSGILRISQSFEIFEAIERACAGEKGVISETINEKLYQIYLSPAVEKGIVISVIMLIIDVSELEKSEKIRREFTANVSHELKTPLTTILGYSQIINNGIAKPEDIRDFTGRIEKETTRLIALVDDIMKLSRLDEADGSGEFTEIHLYDVAKEVSERLTHRAENNNVTLKLSGNDTVIYGDLSQITELVYNLTDNAIKYNREGGQVEISINDRSFSVSDTGIGIPEKYRDRIYERFFRVDKSHSKTIGGTGLGLSIVKHIAQCHGAVINLESEENRGTIFTVTFPK